MSELSEFEKQIVKAEKALDARQLAIEAAKEKIIRSGRVKKLKNKPLKDLSFAELDTMKEDGIFPNEFPQAEGSFPDVSGLYSKILTNLKQILERGGYQVYLKPMKNLIDVRDNIYAIRDALKQNTEPSLGGLEIPIGETSDFEKWDKAYQDIKKTEFVLDYDIDGIARKGDTMIIKNDGTWESKPKYTKEELILTKQEIESMLRSYV